MNQTLVGGLFVLAAVTALGYVAYGSIVASQPAETPDHALQRQMVHEAFRAVHWADRESDVTLNWTPESVESVETLLSYHDAARLNEPPSDAPDETAFAYGAYIGEVAKRLVGGHWVIDEERADHPVLAWDNHLTDLIGWCSQRIADSGADSVWTRFHTVFGDAYTINLDGSAKVLSARTGEVLWTGPADDLPDIDDFDDPEST